MTVTADLADHTDHAVEARPAPDLLAFDHLEWWVGNARHAAHWWATAFGFSIDAYAGPETGVRDRESYVVSQGSLRFVLTNGLGPDDEIGRWVAAHGDGVRDVAYTVADATEALSLATARGAIALVDPTPAEDHAGRAVRSTIAAYGDTRHSFVERGEYRGPFLPGYEAVDRELSRGASIAPPVGLHHADHVVANVAVGELDRWVEWYEQVLGLRRVQQFDADAISTEYSALRSTVVSNGASIVQPINEPAPGRRRSQIEEFLDYYGGPGVQHVAMHTTDIVAAVASIRARGVRCMRVPDAYYDEATERLAGIDADLPWDRLAELGILVDRDDAGYLLQIFTEPVASRPTAFMEVIQREGARGFGEGNFKALFTSIEAEQARRGNL